MHRSTRTSARVGPWTGFCAIFVLPMKVSRSGRQSAGSSYADRTNSLGLHIVTRCVNSCVQTAFRAETPDPSALLLLLPVPFLVWSVDELCDICSVIE